MNKASALIYTRIKHIGFTEKFKIQPEDFSDATAKTVMKYVNDAKNALTPRLCIAHEQVRVILSIDGYVVLGIWAYMQDLCEDGWKALGENEERLGFGFFGYVWKQNEFDKCTKFPPLKAFAELVETYLRPYWNLKKEDPWKYRQDFISYCYEPCEIGEAMRSDFVPAPIEPIAKEEQLIQWAIQKAGSGEEVSVCTNVTIYNVKTYKTLYQYVTTKDSVTKDLHGSNSEDSDTEKTLPVVSTTKSDTKSGMTKQDAFLVTVIGLLVLAVATIPLVWFTGIVWKLVLVVVVIGLSIGIVKRMQR